MTPADPLCRLPAPDAAGCCDPPPAPPAVPAPLWNPPGLAAIRYRIGSFTSFRRAMLAAARRPDLLAAAALPNPFDRWREGSDGDYLTAMIELWAYLADILTFYQERIANEAYLPTATQRDSLQRLAALINYRPGPGAAASGRVAFTVERGKTIAISTRFRVGSRAAAGLPAAVFETEAASLARGEHSAIPLSVVAPTNQFAPLSAFGSVFAVAASPTLLASAAASIYGIAGATYLQTLAGAATAQPAPAAPSSGVGIANAVFKVAASLAPAFVYQPAKGFQPSAPMAIRTVVLKGANNRLAVGDYLLVVENERASGEKPSLRQISTVATDKPTDTTTITWREEANTVYDQSAMPATLHALRVTAAPFGSNAPAWNTLSPTLTTKNGPFKDAKWDEPTNDWFFLPRPKIANQPDDPANAVFLDSLYDDAAGTPDNPGWAVLLTDGKPPSIFHVTDARPMAKADYTVSAKVTRLTFPSGEQIPAKTFPLRGSVILTGAEPLALQNNLPLPEPLTGATLVLAGQYPQLQAGQAVVLQANPIDPTTGAAGAAPAAEPGVLDGGPVVDAANDITTVTLKKPLTRSYARAGAALLANIVDVTQGETVRDEALGSGDGSALQSFALKQKPLTYLPAADPEGLSAVASTLLVTVNGVRWQERPTLLESAPDDQAYTTTQDDSGQTSVVFGDGVNGARPPSGRDNVRARYRKGLGASGNVASGAIAQLIDSLPGLQKVTNPLPSLGGADRESSDQIRVNAPASLRAFGRAVSVDDYAALARSYPGVAKASASWVRRDAATLLAIPNPYIQLTVATADRTPLAAQPTFARQLRAFLDRRRDPNVALRIIDVTPVYVDVAATIDIDDRYPRQATFNQALAALNPGRNADGTAGFFAFDRLEFGQSLHLSAVYAALHAVPGARAATITTFRLVGEDLATVRDSIFIRPTELAAIANDPADTSNQFGKLTLTLGQGGFVDL